MIGVEDKKGLFLIGGRTVTENVPSSFCFWPSIFLVSESAAEAFTHTMSNNLVRKLLRATSDFGDAVEPTTVGTTKKRKRKEQEETKVIASEQDVVDWQVRNMLALDRSMAAKSKVGSGTLWA